MKKVNRRNFLASGLAAAATVTVGKTFAADESYKLIKEALTYNMSLPVSTTIIGVDNVAQIEENVRIASEFSPLTKEEMAELEFQTLPIVRQGLYFRRWELGA